MKTELDSLTLETICGGAAAELFEQEQEKVLDNILDPNTDEKAARKIVLEITYRPGETRTSVATAIEVKSKLGPFKGAGGAAFLARQGGRVVAVTHNPNQLQLEFDAEAKPKAIPANPNTGTEG